MPSFTPPELPDVFLNLVDHAPIEDIVIDYLRGVFGDAVPISAAIQDTPPDRATFPSILIRRVGDYGASRAGHGALQVWGYVQVQVFWSGIDADQQANMTCTAVGNALLRSGFVPVDASKPRGWGRLVGARKIDSPHRVSDWATSSGPVQYADLPIGATRHEGIYAVRVRVDSDRFVNIFR